jgi:hypothetical protein
MRVALLGVLAALLLLPVASAVTAQHRDALFPMAQGFDDKLTIVSGKTEFTAPTVGASTGFFRVSRTQIDGITKVCWPIPLEVVPQCVDGPLTIVIPEGASFGINAPAKFPVSATAQHALTTFVDLSQADGFNGRLLVGPSAIASLVDSHIAVGPLPALSATRQGALTTLESGSTIEVHNAAGAILHTMRFDDQPLVVEGNARFPDTFSAQVFVLPFDDGASLHVTPADHGAAVTGLSKARLDVLDDVVHNVRFISSAAKSSPLSILSKAGSIVSEVFNGAFIRARLADNPGGLGDVDFAKFTDLTITAGTGGSLDFDGSYTLVVGDLGPAFSGSKVSGGSLPVRWWVGVLLVLAVVMTGAYLWLREGPMAKPAPGPQTLFARVATAVGVVALFLVWDLQLHGILGSSILTTGAHGAALGILLTLELASMVLAGLLIGVPIYLIARYGLALLKKPQFAALSSTVAVFLTLGLGILILPALVAFLINIAPWIG